MPFLYFIPDVTTLSREKITQLGLDYADLKTGGRGVNGGPGGKNGVITCGGGDAGAGYYPLKQIWAPAPQGDEDEPPFWVGYAKADKPTPESLQRAQLHGGEWVTFLDGSKWLVPHLREWLEGDSDASPVLYQVTLPCLVTVDRYGLASKGGVIPAYEQIYEAGLKIHAQLAHGVRSLTDAQWLQFAADLLSMNYRVGLFELSEAVSKYLSCDDAVAVVKAGIDFDGYTRTMGNVVGRLTRPTDDLPSGFEPPTPDEATPTDPQLVN